MFDDVKDRIARLSVARLQKRIDALKAQQEMLDKFTAQRGLNELEHYRMQMSIGVASMVFFLVLIVFGTCMALMVKMHTNTQFELILSALILLMFFIIIGGIGIPIATRPSSTGRRLVQSIVLSCNAE